MEAYQVVTGRPLGGVLLLWHRDFQHAIFPVACTSDRRLVVKMTTLHGIILVIALYMSVDYGDGDGLNEYTMELGFLKGTLEMVLYDHVCY